MKYLFIFLMSILLMTAPAMGAVYYVDLETGDDTTGTGAWDNPWKTVDKCTTSGATTGGDECRVAKIDTHVTLSGTVTATLNSTTINTTDDLQAEVSAGDFVGIGTGGIAEVWVEVSSVDASSITLTDAWFGPTSGSGLTFKKADRFEPSDWACLDVNSAGTSMASRLKISGGWTLSASSTQDGTTTVDWTGNGGAIDFANNDYIEYQNFVLLGNCGALYSKFALDMGDWGKIHDMGFSCFRIAQDLDEHEHFWEFEDITIYAGNDVAIELNRATGWFLTNIDVYGGGTANQAKVTNSFGISFQDVDFYNQYSSSSEGIYADQAHAFYLKDCDFDYNLNDQQMYVGGSGQIINSSFANATTGLYLTPSRNPGWYIDGLTYDTVTNPFIYRDITVANTACNVFVENYNDVAADDWIECISTTGNNRIKKNTAEARSGSCLEFDINQNNGNPCWELGRAKVTSTGSDMVFNVWFKDDASWNGRAMLFTFIDGKKLDNQEISPTTSWAKTTVTASSGSLTLGKYIVQKVCMYGQTAGGFYVDDWNWTQ